MRGVAGCGRRRRWDDLKGADPAGAMRDVRIDDRRARTRLPVAGPRLVGGAARRPAGWRPSEEGAGPPPRALNAVEQLRPIGRVWHGPGARSLNDGVAADEGVSRETCGARLEAGGWTAARPVLVVGEVGEPGARRGFRAASAAPPGGARGWGRVSRPAAAEVNAGQTYIGEARGGASARSPSRSAANRVPVDRARLRAAAVDRHAPPQPHRPARPSCWPRSRGAEIPHRQGEIDPGRLRAAGACSAGRAYRIRAGWRRRAGERERRRWALAPGDPAVVREGARARPASYLPGAPAPERLALAAGGPTREARGAARPGIADVARDRGRALGHAAAHASNEARSGSTSAARCARFFTQRGDRPAGGGRVRGRARRADQGRA